MLDKKSFFKKLHIYMLNKLLLNKTNGRKKLG